MKRLDESGKEWNYLHSEFSAERKLGERKRRHERELVKLGVKARLAIDEKKRTVIQVPENFNLYRNLRESLSFFNDIRISVLSARNKAIIDFHSCRSISSGAGLILAAEADRCRQLRQKGGIPTLTGNYPKDRGMRLFLDEIGFFKLLKIPSLGDVSEIASPTKHIAMRSGSRDRGEAVNYVTEVFGTESVQLEEDAKDALHSGLLEAMNNVTSHAYPQTGPRPSYQVLHGRWWAAGHWDRVRREIRALIYDQGVGIPATLPFSPHRDLIPRIRQRLNLRHSDAESIQAAMEIGMSRSSSEHRGIGMSTLLRAVDQVADGHLLILSRQGGYLHRTGQEDQTFPLPLSIGGTFIEWRIRDDQLVRWNVNGRPDN